MYFLTTQKMVGVYIICFVATLILYGRQNKGMIKLRNDEGMTHNYHCSKLRANEHSIWLLRNTYGYLALRINYTILCRKFPLYMHASPKTQ